MVDIPSPALAVVGRHNSGKTTLLVQLIAELVARGYDVGSVKHHHHIGFDIDIPGKDSYRQRAAGASETVIAAPGQIARIKTIEDEVECDDIVQSMPNHDIVLVEGYRKSGLPTIEIMRAANNADMIVANVLLEGARRGWPLGADFTQIVRELRDCEDDEERQRVLDERGDKLVEESLRAQNERLEAIDTAHANSLKPIAAVDIHVEKDIKQKMPSGNTVAICTDIPEAIEAAKMYGIPSFDINDIKAVATYVEEHYTRPKITVVIQAGGESRRMGRSKATVPFNGRPLICRLVERLYPAADELVITTNEPENLEFLYEKFPQVNLKLVRDVYDFRGALPGLWTALNAASHNYVAVVACDMVNASASLVVAESIALNEHGSDVVVPVNSHGFEPFHAMYRRDTCIPKVRSALDAGERRAQSFFSNADIYEFTQAEVLRVVPGGGCFANCNTPEELHALERAVEL